MRLAGSGAGAAAIACLDLLVAIGLKREKITICDSKGVVHRGRQDLDADKARYATDTSARTLADAMQGADVFLGLSQGGLVKPDMVKSLAAKPLILALANPSRRSASRASDCILMVLYLIACSFSLAWTASKSARSIVRL